MEVKGFRLHVISFALDFPSQGSKIIRKDILVDIGSLFSFHPINI